MTQMSASTRTRTSQPTLAGVLRSAVKESLKEAEQLEGYLVKLSEQLVARSKLIGLRSETDAVNQLVDKTKAALTDDFADAVLDPFRERAAKLGKVNLVLFGRTGAGKSTLVDALARRNGAAVSQQGRLDNTTQIRAATWRGLRVVDTPGIQGWGRSVNRVELEKRAHDAVCWADLVVLCFDSANAKEGEFEQIARWVSRRGKPVIAVVNVRNHLWRMSQDVPDAAVRETYSLAVRQACSHIERQLNRAGLRNTPIICMNSLRALAARGERPLEHTFAAPMDAELERFGDDELARIANLGLLEDLLVALLSSEPEAFRLAAIRTQIQASLQGTAGELAGIEKELLEHRRERVALVKAALELTGSIDIATRASLPDRLRPARRPSTTKAIYLKEAGKAGISAPKTWTKDRLIAELVGHESAAQSTSRTLGSVFAIPRNDNPLASIKGIDLPSEDCERRMRQRVDAFLDKPFGKAKAAARSRAKTLIQSAFKTGHPVDADAVQRKVLSASHVKDLSKEVTAVAQRFSADLAQEMKVDAEEVTADLRADFESIEVDPGAHDVDLRIGRGMGFAGAGLLGAVPFAAEIPPLAGLLLVGGLILGGLSRRKMERARNAKKAQEKSATDTLYESIDSSLTVIRESADTSVRSHVARMARAAVVPLLTDLTALDQCIAAVTDARRDMELNATEVASKSIDPRKSVLEAKRRVESDRNSKHGGKIDIWRGEDWLEEPTAGPSEASDRVTLPERAADSSLNFPDRRRVEDWFSAALQTLEQAPKSRAEVKKARKTMARRPSVVLLGDYSSGKSSLVRRLLVEHHGAHDVRDLKVGADPTTRRPVTKKMGQIDLVDVPGLASGNSRHDDAAARAIASASLILCAHVPGFGNIEPVAAAMTDGAVHRGHRTLHVLNRIDEETGVPSTRTVETHMALIEYKCCELAEALTKAGVDCAPGRVFAVAADPLGSNAQQTMLTREHFEYHRGWDGIDRLFSAIKSAGPDLLESGRSAAALDVAATELLRRRVAIDAELRRNDARLDELARTVGRCERVAARLDAEVTNCVNELRSIIRAHGDNRANELLKADIGLIKRIGESPSEWVEYGFSEHIAGWDTKWEKRFESVTNDLKDRLSARVTRKGFDALFRDLGGDLFDDLRDSSKHPFGSSDVKHTFQVAGKWVGDEASKRLAIRLGEQGAAVAGRTLGAAVAGVVELASQAKEESDHRKLKQEQKSVANAIEVECRALAESLTGTDESPVGKLHELLEPLVTELKRTTATWRKATAKVTATRQRLITEQAAVEKLIHDARAILAAGAKEIS